MQNWEKTDHLKSCVRNLNDKLSLMLNGLGLPTFIPPRLMSWEQHVSDKEKLVCVFLHKCMHVGIFLCMCAFGHEFVFVHVWLHVFVCLRVCPWVFVCISVCIWMCWRVRFCKSMDVRVHVRVCAYGCVCSSALLCVCVWLCVGLWLSCISMRSYFLQSAYTDPLRQNQIFHIVKNLPYTKNKNKKVYVNKSL